MVQMDEELLLTNAGATNVSIPKDGVIAYWGDRTCIQQNGEGFPYSLTLKTKIFDKQTTKKTTLAKYMQEGRVTTSIWKYKAFPPGALPKALVYEDPNSTYQFDSRHTDRDVILASAQACRGLTCASLVWAVRHNAKEMRIEPDGLALLADKAIIVPGERQFKLQ